MTTRRIRAFSVAELVLALAITSLIGLSVTGVYMVLDTAQANTDLHYEHLQTSAAVSREIERTLRPSRLVLAADANGLALWAGDDNDDGLINLSEIVVFYLADRSDKLTRVRVAFSDAVLESMRTSLDQSVSLSEFTSVAGARKLLYRELPSYWQEDLLAEEVSGAAIQTDEDPPCTTVLKLKLQIGTDTEQVTRYLGGRLRVHDVDRVRVGEAGYILTN